MRRPIRPAVSWREAAMWSHSFPKCAVCGRFYEINFLLSIGTEIYPIEVKSSGYKSPTTLDAFYEKFSKNVG